MFKGERLFTKLNFRSFFFLLIITISCDQLTEESSKETNSEDINFTQVYKTFEEPNCPNGTCAQVKITTVESGQNHRVNQFVEKKLADIVLAFTRNEKANSLDEVTSYFFNDYKEFKQAFPESRTPWELDIKMDVNWMSRKKGWLSLRFETYSYTGGAHPSTYTEYINISSEGKILSTSDWISNETLLLDIAEDAFRKSKKISASQNLGDAGYTFEADAFMLSENVGFKDGNLILHYNDYEISSYAEGSTIVEIPLSTLSEAVSL